MHLTLETARRLVLTHDRCQHAHTAGGWEHDVAHRTVGLQAGGLGDLDQQSLLAVDPLDLVSERLEHSFSGLAADLVDDLDQQIDQPIRELALPMRKEQRIKSMAPAVRMPAHGPGCLVEHTTPKYPRDGAAQIRTCGNRQRQTLHEGEPPGCDQDVVEVGLARIGFQV